MRPSDAWAPPHAPSHGAQPGYEPASPVPSSSKSAPPPGDDVGSRDVLIEPGPPLDIDALLPSELDGQFSDDAPLVVMEDASDEELDLFGGGGVPLTAYPGSAAAEAHALAVDAALDAMAETSSGYDASFEADSSSDLDEEDAYHPLGQIDDLTVFDDGMTTPSEESDYDAEAELPFDLSNMGALPQPPPPPVPPPEEPLYQLQQLHQQLQADTADLLNGGGGPPLAHPTAFTNPNPMTLNPGNYNFRTFVAYWAWHGRLSQGPSPHLTLLGEQRAEKQGTVSYADLEGDRCDMQGIDWHKLGVTRKDARERRRAQYKNYVNKAGSDQWHVSSSCRACSFRPLIRVAQPRLPNLNPPQSASFFRFQRMHLSQRVHLSHFQLRNLLACHSRRRSFYAGLGVVDEINPLTGATKQAMSYAGERGTISTLDAGHGVLVAGDFTGEYLLRNLEAAPVDGAPPTTRGVITSHPSGITNHVQIFQPRGSATPHAAFASNDMGFRIIDLETLQVVCQTAFPYPLNCTALSPDGRLRVAVGDSDDVLIVAADNARNAGGVPDIQMELGGHSDYGFACDWADDGYTVATGFQDKAIKIWDARKWCNSRGAAQPVCTLSADMAGVRSLRFSPAGSGKRVLVAAEEADFVNIFDATTFGSKQRFDVFGEIGGVAFADEGRRLQVLCCDPHRGGLLQFDRYDHFAEELAEDLAPARDTPPYEYTDRPAWEHRGDAWRRRGFDWMGAAAVKSRQARALATRRRLDAVVTAKLPPL